MRYEIIFRGELVGTSDLEDRDESIGVAIGRFVPGPAYESVRPVFLHFTEAEEQNDAKKMKLYYDARQRLQLTLRNQHGLPIETTAIHIDTESYEVVVILASVKEVSKLDQAT